MKSAVPNLDIMTQMTTDELRRRVLEVPERVIPLGEYLKRHALMLHVIFTRKGKPGQAHFTGILFERQGILYWVTAAHCLDAIQEALGDATVEIKASRWLDHDTRVHARGIPMDLKGMLTIRVATEMLDLAAIPLLGNTADLLRGCDTFAPLTEQVWGKNPEIPPGLLAVGGYPGEWFKGSVSESATSYEVTFSAGHALLPVDPLRAPADPLAGPPEWWARDDCIYGSVVLPTTVPHMRLESIVGMSGGPVFSLEWDERANTVRYRLYGIQSEWLPKSRIVRIERIESVPALIAAYISAMRENGVAPDEGSA